MPSTAQKTVDVELGQRVVSVPGGGLFDRYRMQTDLDEVSKDPCVQSVDFFRRLRKTRVESPIGPTHTPNVYYAMSSARLTMLAPTSAIRKRIPAELEPLEIVPGLGIASVMFFRYDVCDIDFYTEAAVGVAVRPARHGGPSVERGLIRPIISATLPLAEAERAHGLLDSPDSVGKVLLLPNRDYTA